MEDSISVPGVTTLTTCRSTRPFASEGSWTCSHIATLCPFSMSFAIYCSDAWWGTPHIGARSERPQSLPVRVISRSFEAIIASSKNIS